MQSLLFRIEMTERARLPAPDEAAFASLIAAVRELRTSFEDSLEAIQQRIEGHVPAGVLTDTTALIDEYRRQLDSLRDDPAVDTTDRETAGRVLVLAGYYRALADAIERCHETVEASRLATMGAIIHLVWASLRSAPSLLPFHHLMELTRPAKSDGWQRCRLTSCTSMPVLRSTSRGTLTMAIG